MSDKIPITFTHSGIAFDAYFTPVTGAGDSVWHLYSFNNYYLGQLTLINDKFSFHGAKLEELSQFFGDYIRAYLE